MIKQVGSKWVLFSQDGSKKLGTFASRAAAEEREKEIEMFKHMDMNTLIRKAARR